MHLVDLLGPPPAAIIAWEQQHYMHLLHPQQLPQQQQPVTSSAAGAGAGSTCASRQETPRPDLSVPKRAGGGGAAGQLVPGANETGAGDNTGGRGLRPSSYIKSAK
jgi:hypothetical protein